MLTEGVLMDENQNEAKDMFLTLCFCEISYAMTCCVAINAKEGDCWKYVLSLMLHNIKETVGITQMSQTAANSANQADSTN